VIFPDNDPAGKNHARQVAAAIFSYTLDVRIVEPPGIEEHGDVSVHVVRSDHPYTKRSGDMVYTSWLD
jgi:hypothetical protein